MSSVLMDDEVAERLILFCKIAGFSVDKCISDYLDLFDNSDIDSMKEYLSTHDKISLMDGAKFFGLLPIFL